MRELRHSKPAVAPCHHTGTKRPGVEYSCMTDLERVTIVGNQEDRTGIELFVDVMDEAAELHARIGEEWSNKLPRRSRTEHVKFEVAPLEAPVERRQNLPAYGQQAQRIGRSRYLSN